MPPYDRPMLVTKLAMVKPKVNAWFFCTHGANMGFSLIAKYGAYKVWWAREITLGNQWGACHYM